MVVNYLQTYSLNIATYFLVVFGWNESPVQGRTHGGCKGSGRSPSFVQTVHFNNIYGISLP